MSVKTIFIIAISVLLTIVLMNNTEEMDFWLFGNARVPKLAILGSMFCLGLIIGFLASRPKSTSILPHEPTAPPADNLIENNLSDEDREYIR